MSARPTTERSFAKDLGARIVNLKSKDVGGALRNFAQLEGIRNVVLGRSAHSRDDILSWLGHQSLPQQERPTQPFRSFQWKAVAQKNGATVRSLH